MEVSAATELLNVLVDALNDTSMGLTHCGLVTPFGDIDVSQYCLSQWLDAWQHDAITWTNIEFSFVKLIWFSLESNSQRVIKLSFYTIRFKYALLKSHPLFSKDNVLIWN